MLQSFDEGVIHFLNGYAGHSVIFDRITNMFVSAPSFRTIPFILCLVWLWFDHTRRPNQRVLVFTGLA
jgi:hypothetical protein